MSKKSDKKKKKRKMETSQRKGRKMSAAATVTDFPDLNHLARPWREFYLQVIKQISEG